MSNYSRGADFERAVVKHLEKEGYLAFRCAGSKGNSKVDVIAIPPISIPFSALWQAQVDENHLRGLLIQCKISGAISKFEQKQLSEAAEKYGFCAIIAKKAEDKKGEIVLEFCKDGGTAKT